METTTGRRQGTKLLTPKELTSCKTIAEAGNDYSPRAAALILINSGSTHAQAAENTVLTLGQLKYWLTRFRKLRLASFPESATVRPAEAEAEAEAKSEKAKQKDKKKVKDKKKDKAKDKKKDKKKDKDNKKAKKAKKKK